MSKRHLTRRQRWRIDKIQQERLDRADRKDRHLTDQLSGSELGIEQEGLVIAHQGSLIQVEPANKELPVHSCRFRTNLPEIVTGDQVVWRADPHGGGVIVAIQPRHSELVRPDPQGRIKTVAANIDNVLVVITPQPATPTGLIDRYLIAAETLGIPATLVLNKADLIQQDDSHPFWDIARRYQKLGYPLICTSTRGTPGLSALIDRLKQGCSIFVGQSGVGKSSLVNLLLPEARLKTSELSEATGKGVHTTTTARLFHLPGGGDIIDSPGIREFGLWHIDYQDLVSGFREFQPWLGQCKFRDCRHLNEPGCALQQACSEGLIEPERLQNFHRIADELRNNTT